MSPPRYDRIVFRKSPLRLVIGQVRFPLLFRFNERPFLAPFQEALAAEYPRVGQEQQIAVKFSARGVEPGGEMLWRFGDRDGSWSVVLSEGALTLESRKYTSIDEFVSRFQRVLQAAETHLGVTERTRLGLRFINELRAPRADTLARWAQLLNPAFVGFAGSGVVEGDVRHAFHELRTTRADGFLVIRHGLLAGTTVEPRPGEKPEEGPFYLIDLDYFVEAERELNVEAEAAQLRAYNEAIYQFFRWSVDEGAFFEQMEPL